MMQRENLTVLGHTPGSAYNLPELKTALRSFGPHMFYWLTTGADGKLYGRASVIVWVRTEFRELQYHDPATQADETMSIRAFNDMRQTGFSLIYRKGSAFTMMKGSADRVR